jgi:hypothetical protein
MADTDIFVSSELGEPVWSGHDIHIVNLKRLDFDKRVAVHYRYILTTDAIEKLYSAALSCLKNYVNIVSTMKTCCDRFVDASPLLRLPISEKIKLLRRAEQDAYVRVVYVCRTMYRRIAILETGLPMELRDSTGVCTYARDASRRLVHALFRYSSQISAVDQTSKRLDLDEKYYGYINYTGLMAMLDIYSDMSTSVFS